jgi:LmbE family N-acetylglucosaminyl deacetylase/glycosyltransferase involved in cell wall biosynthesis
MRNNDTSTLLSASGPAPRLLFFAPHPDDETLAGSRILNCAAQRRLPLKVVFVTNGDNNPWPQCLAEWRWHIGTADRLRWGARRSEEALRALAVLGIAVPQAAFWGFRDQELTEELNHPEPRLLRAITAELVDFRPTLVVAPSRLDLHPDHNALGVLVSLALATHADRSISRLHYIVHGDPGAVRHDNIVVSEMTAPQRALKRMALEQYTTQLLLSRRRFMRYVDRTEYFIRDDAVATDAPWGHPAAPGEWDISLPKDALAGVVGVRVHVLAAPGAHVTRRIGGSAPRKTSEVVQQMNMAIHTAQRHDGRIALRATGRLNPLWLKFDAPLRFLDGSGWLRIVPAPALHIVSRRVCCVIPCYNVARYCGDVIERALRCADEVVAIDDGSTDATPRILADLANRYPHLHVLAHPRNRGKGAALIAAFRYALEHIDFAALVTLDADAQHDAKDIAPLVLALHTDGVELAVGVRDRLADMPLRSRIGNMFMGAIIRLAVPTAPADTQSGFRAHRREFIAHLVERVDGRRYETELQILVQALRRGRIASVTIPTVYLDSNRSSHFRPLRDSLRVLAALVKCCPTLPALPRRPGAFTRGPRKIPYRIKFSDHITRRTRAWDNPAHQRHTD